MTVALQHPLWCLGDHFADDYHRSPSTSITCDDSGAMLVLALMQDPGPSSPAYVVLHLEPAGNDLPLNDRAWMGTDGLVEMCAQILGFARIADTAMLNGTALPSSPMRDGLAAAAVRATGERFKGRPAADVLDGLLQAIDAMLDGAR